MVCSGDTGRRAVTFEEKGGWTRVVVHDLYPSKEALEAAIASGSTEGVVLGTPRLASSNAVLRRNRAES